MLDARGGQKDVTLSAFRNALPGPVTTQGENVPSVLTILNSMTSSQGKAILSPELLMVF